MINITILQFSVEDCSVNDWSAGFKDGFIDFGNRIFEKNSNYSDTISFMKFNSVINTINTNLVSTLILYDFTYDNE